MKELKEGYTTGTCATASSLASVIWQINGVCPEYVEIDTPTGKKFTLEIKPVSYGECGVVKDSGDDPDITNGCTVISKVKISETDGEIKFLKGTGIGIITKKGLKLDIGEPAINPVPRMMIEEAVRSVIGTKGAEVTISIPDGEKLAEKTFNSRLGVEGGLSILGTTGIVRPMSEDAVKESLKLELSMCREEYGEAVAMVTGYSGEKYLKNEYQNCGGVVLCSNYLGYLLDCAEEMGFTHILFVGGTGKLVKPSADIMNLHSHIAGGQREIICTHSALAGASVEQIKELYKCTTTKHAQTLLKRYGIANEVWKSIAEEACIKCELRTHGKIKTAMILIDDENKILAQTDSLSEVIEKWEKI